jgi:hypothetical protein
MSRGSWRAGGLPVAVLACCLAALAALAAPAGASGVKAIWGPVELEAGNAACPQAEEPCSAFPVYRELGVDVFQFQIHWDEVAPTRPRNPRDPLDPAYDWGEIDEIVAEARANGIGLAALVQRSPRWANGGRPPIWAPPDPGAFADFMFAASRRFPAIRMWMIWGEPAREENFMPMREGDRRGPRLYARIVDASYAALKQADRRNRVIGGMTLNGGTVMPPLFLRWMTLPNGRPPRMDLWGHNPFDGRFPDLSDDPIGRFRGFNDIDTIHREVRAVYRRGNRPVPRLWLSEWTIVSDRASRIFVGTHVSPKEQAHWLRTAFRIARTTPYVAGLGWFSLLDEPPAPGSAAWGLMRSDGARKPSFGAYKSVP